MRKRLWGHDGIRIEMPYAVAKILADPTHPDRPELIDSIASTISAMLRIETLADMLARTAPIAVRVEGVLRDGEDMTMGPVAYVRKMLMDDVVADFEALSNSEDINTSPQ